MVMVVWVTLSNQICTEDVSSQGDDFCRIRGGVGWLVGGQIESDPRGILEGSDPQIRSEEVLVGGGCVGE